MYGRGGVETDYNVLVYTYCTEIIDLHLHARLVNHPDNNIIIILSLQITPLRLYVNVLFFFVCNFGSFHRNIGELNYYIIHRRSNMIRFGFVVQNKLQTNEPAALFVCVCVYGRGDLDIQAVELEVLS